MRLIAKRITEVPAPVYDASELPIPAPPASPPQSMTAQQIIGLALRLTAIWLFLIPLQLLALTAEARTVFDDDAAAPWIALSLLPLLPAIFLWFFPMVTAHKLLPRSDAGGSAHLRDAFAAAAIILGIWSVLHAFPVLFGTLSVALMSDNSAVVAYHIEAASVSLIFAATQCVIGMALIVMPRVLAHQVFPAPRPALASRKTA